MVFQPSQASIAQDQRMDDATVAGDEFDKADALLLAQARAVRLQLRHIEQARHALFTGRIAAASASGCRYIAGHSAA